MLAEISLFYIIYFFCRKDFCPHRRTAGDAQSPSNRPITRPKQARHDPSHSVKFPCPGKQITVYHSIIFTTNTQTAGPPSQHHQPEARARPCLVQTLQQACTGDHVYNRRVIRLSFAVINPPLQVVNCQECAAVPPLSPAPASPNLAAFLERGMSKFAAPRDRNGAPRFCEIRILATSASHPRIHRSRSLISSGETRTARKTNDSVGVSPSGLRQRRYGAPCLSAIKTAAERGRRTHARTHPASRD